MLPIDLTRFPCHCYFALLFHHMSMPMMLQTNIFFWNITYEKQWFLVTWALSPCARSSSFQELNENMQSWLSLFYEEYALMIITLLWSFFFLISSEALPYVKPFQFHICVPSHYFPLCPSKNMPSYSKILVRWLIHFWGL